MSRDETYSAVCRMNRDTDHGVHSGSPGHGDLTGLILRRGGGGGVVVLVTCNGCVDGGMAVALGVGGGAVRVVVVCVHEVCCM